MSDEWFREKLAPDGDVEDGCHAEAAEALKEYLRHQINAHEAAQRMIHPVITASDPSDEIWRLWSLLEDALVELPESNIEALLQLIRAIEELPPPDFDALLSIRVPSYKRLWKGLSSFGHMWFDSYCGGVREILRFSEPGERNKLREKHVRKAKVEARLVLEGLAGFDMDLGYKTLTKALEEENAVLDFEVPAAAQWLVIARQRMIEDAEKRKESRALERNHPLWKGEKVMTHERLAFWISRLEQLQETSEAARDVAESVFKALDTET